MDDESDRDEDGTMELNVDATLSLRMCFIKFVDEEYAVQRRDSKVLVVLSVIAAVAGTVEAVAFGLIGAGILHAGLFIGLLIVGIIAGLAFVITFGNAIACALDIRKRDRQIRRHLNAALTNVAMHRVYPEGVEPKYGFIKIDDTV